MSETLKQQLENLTDRQVLEAGLFLSAKLTDARTSLEVMEQLEACYEDAGVHKGEIDRALLELADPSKATDLTRLFLMVADAEGFTEEVEKAIQGAGKKQDFGALTIVAPMVILGFGILVTRLKKSETTKSSMKIDSDGSASFEKESRTEYYSLGEAVGHVLKTALEGIVPKNPSQNQ